jgi:cell division protein FtsL
MPSVLTQSNTYKSPAWMKNKPFPKRKPGKSSVIEQMFVVIIFAIIAMVLMS